MKTKGNLYLIFTFIFLYSYPVYGSGYEDVSLAKTILQLIFYIIIFALVIFFSLYGTKLIAKNFKSVGTSKYISIIDMINIPGGSKIIITKINNKVYIMSITNSATTVIDIIDEENFSIRDEEFDNYLSKYLKQSNESKINKTVIGLLSKLNIKKDKEGKDHEEKY
ncbi:hypothetical protein RBU61_08015 [Tissierella sp. MB52-C2]|uniref:hypothetical protein n=1 Tax=Tissierella sp. MB52-C2 TaxID=3070999 RepID=UPI00280C131F|nr:hypothetical protein [Tissierella sp. MB52-C2]WMM26610.1 hypothetical protein RBU61_08015 [Tissierella sp. MB52-C2]